MKIHSPEKENTNVPIDAWKDSIRIRNGIISSLKLNNDTSL